jgi:hypothetical protein
MKDSSLIALIVAALRDRTGKWDVIKYAIGNTGRTIRLIALIVVTTLPPGAAAFLVDLLARR